MFDITDEQKAKIVALLRVAIPDADYYVYGSRARGEARKLSDLDIMIKSHDQKRIPMMAFGEAVELLSASNLPFRVDLNDYHSTDPDFIRMIEQGFVALANSR